VGVFPAPALQRACLVEQPVRRARPAHLPRVPHLRQALRQLQDHLPKENHQQGLTLRRHRAHVRGLRAHRPEKSGVGEPDPRRQNPRAAEPEKSGAEEPDQRKQNLRAAVLNFSENLLLGQPGNLHLKQQIPVKEPRKGHKRGVTGNQKGARLTHLRPGNRSKGILLRPRFDTPSGRTSEIRLTPHLSLRGRTS
jgi:hypothetical protein